MAYKAKLYAKRVPKWKCRRCVHYSGQCPLLDLDPCKFVYDPHEKVKDRFLAAVTMIAIGFCALLLFAGCAPKKPEPQFIPKWSVVQMLRQQRHELSQWQMLQMAIVWTESKGNPDALGAAGDSGVMQIREIYVAEVNRLYGTDYTIADAFDITKSLEMFNLLQDYYNPEHDIEKAIYYHNKSAAYKMKALQNLELIRRMEAVRSVLTKD